MPFINAAMDEAKEQEVVPEGTYSLRNEYGEVKDSKKGTPMIEVMTLIESSEHPNAAPIMSYFSLPRDEDEPKAKAFKLLQLRRFCEVFEIPFEDNGFDTDDIAGSTGNCGITQETYQPVLEDGSPDPNKEPIVSNKLRLPRLSSEPAEEKKPEPKKSATNTKRRR